MKQLHSIIIALLLLGCANTGMAQSFISTLPANTEEFSKQQTADTLNKIAVHSYTVLIDVPAHGLDAKSAEIIELTDITIWLEAQHKPLFYLLSFAMRAAVDTAIFSELQRTNERKSGGEVSQPFVENSVSNATLSALLDKNKIDEVNLLTSLLQFDGDFIKKCCKDRSYSANDFITNKIWHYTSRPKFREQYENKLAYAGFESIAENKIADFLLLTALIAMDESWDIRFMGDLHIKNNGLLVYSRKEFIQNIEAELTRRYGEDTDNRKKYYGRDEVSASDYSIRETASEYSEDKSGDYEKRITMFFYPFLTAQDIDNLPEKSRKHLKEEFYPFFQEINEKPATPGAWLYLAPAQSN
jgi:hypothetical protein